MATITRENSMVKSFMVVFISLFLNFSTIFSWNLKFTDEIENFIKQHPNHTVIENINFLRKHPFNGEKGKIDLLISIIRLIAFELSKEDKYSLPMSFYVRSNLRLNNILDWWKYDQPGSLVKEDEEKAAASSSWQEPQEYPTEQETNPLLLPNVQPDNFKYPPEISSYCLLNPLDVTVKSLKFALRHDTPARIRSWVNVLVMKLKERKLIDNNCNESEIASKLLELNGVKEVQHVARIMPKMPPSRRQLLNLLMHGQQNSESDIKDNEYRSKLKKVDLVGGFPEVLEDIRRMLNNDVNYQEVGASNPRNILLYGLPGTGKTRSVKALAGELGYSFVYKSASEFVNKYVGEGAANVRAFFDLLIQLATKRSEGVIVLLDEVDAVAVKREDSHDERRQTLIQLMTYLDGVDLDDAVRDKITIFFATNRKDDLDDALIRAGRVNAIVELKLPDKSTRKELLKYYFGKKTRKIKKDTNLDSVFDKISQNTDGCNYADMENIVNKASIHAARSGKGIGFEDFEAAVADTVKSVAMDTSLQMMYL
jgi:ATP-dependent 26S proteasome regulatory subunit